MQRPLVRYAGNACKKVETFHLIVIRWRYIRTRRYLEVQMANLAGTQRLGKRIRKVYPNPNPLFEKWLTEWKVEAAEKGWKTQYVYKKALDSLKKYPLPLKSGKDAKVLEYFGDKICKMLDDKLAEHKAAGNHLSDDSHIDMDAITPPSTPTKKKSKSGENGGNPKIYLPVRRSGPYALILTLYTYQKMPNSKGYMGKSDLMQAAQPHSEKSFRMPEPGSHYTAWSSMGTLIRKGLITKYSNPARYALSDSGMNLGEKIMLAEERLTRPNEISAETPSCSQSSMDSSPIDAIEYSGPAFTRFTMEPGQFDVILCVDTCETSTGAHNERKLAVQTELRKNGVNFDIRKLHVGDFIWVAREKVVPVPGQLVLPEPKELVLNYVVERKRMDDLTESIKDGRFKEQKYRLKSSGFKNIIYLVEDCGNNANLSLPIATLLQAVTNTQVCDGFTIKRTHDQKETVAYLTIFTRYLQSHHLNKSLSNCSWEDFSRIRDHDITDCVHRLMSYTEFSSISVKNKQFTVKEMFIKQLLQISGMSVEKALEIVQRYPTPKSLMAAYDKCQPEDKKEAMLKNLKFGKLARNIGPAISRVVYRVYCTDF